MAFFRRCVKQVIYRYLDCRFDLTISHSALYSARIVLPASYKSSSAGESHPHALREPDVSLSAHPAPIVQPTHTQNASEQTTMVGVF